MTLEQLRAAHRAGAFSGAELIAHGSTFHIVVHARTNDQVVLLPANDPGAAIRFLHSAGFGSVSVDISQWTLGA